MFDLCGKTVLITPCSTNLEGPCHAGARAGAFTGLQAGDIVVQRGTNHAWSDHADEMARMVSVLHDGEFCEDLTVALPAHA